MDMTRKINSGYFGKEFEVNTVITDEGRELIRHASLVNIIFNELDPAPLVTYQMQQSTPDYPMVYCTIADEKRRITAFGESTPLARQGNPIAEAHPGAMAHNAAFDLAAKIFLGIRNDFYTDEEIPTFRASGTNAAATKTEPAPAEAHAAAPAEVHAESEAVEEPKAKRGRPRKDTQPKPEPAAPVMPEPVPADEEVEVAVSENDPAENAIVIDDEPVEHVTETPATEPAAAESAADIDPEAAKYGAMKINVGLYKDKPNNTIAEVVANDPAWIGRILQLKNPNAVVSEKIDALKKYISAAGLSAQFGL